MEEQKIEWLIQRAFGYAKIVWEIENCFCETYKKKWEILSPVFSVNGFLSIKWRFVLKATKIDDDEEYVASIYLERLSADDISRAVRVFWNLSFSIDKENITICQREGVFNTKGCISSRIKNFKKFEEGLQLISTDKLNVEAIFLVTSTEDSAAFERSTDIGLRTLSQELGVIYNLKDYYDLTVNVGKNSLEGHKAILTAGNKFLRDVIDQRYGKKDIYLDWSNDKSAGKVFSYLYTGNVGYVLRMPSILIDEAINYFGVKELEKYYMKDEIILHTKFEAKEFYYKWIVTDIYSRDESFLFSPYFGERDLNITFRLRLGLSEIYGPTGNVSIFLEAAFPQQFHDLYIIFDIIDIFGNSINHKKAARWSPEDGETLELENFLSGNILRELAVVSNGSLSILCSFFIPMDIMLSSDVKNRTSLLTYSNYEDHYYLFSKRIESLFETGNYSDLTIKCWNRRFFVHKCILSARSPVFARAIRVLENNRGFSIRDVEPNVLQIVLIYIYSGVLKDYEFSDVPKIYLAAVKFGMLILKYQCGKVLEDNLQASNVFDTLSLAFAHKETKLKFSAFKFLMYNRCKIREQDKWDQFVNENALYGEFKEYVRVHIGNNHDEGFKLEDF